MPFWFAKIVETLWAFVLSEMGADELGGDASGRCVCGSCS